MCAWVAWVVGLDTSLLVAGLPYTWDDEGKNYIHHQERRLVDHTRPDSKGK